MSLDKFGQEKFAVIKCMIDRFFMLIKYAVLRSS